MGQGVSCLRAAGPQIHHADSAKGRMAAEKPAAAASNQPIVELPDAKTAPTSAAMPLGRAPQPNLPLDVEVNGPPLPPCEEERLQVSHVPELIDAVPREDLQNILQLLCSMFHTKNSLISLFADRRVHIINSTGIFQEGNYPWRSSFCAWTLASEHPTVMVVNDATQDSRFCHNPWVTTLQVRSYLSAPLVSNTGHRLGTICLADPAPRVFDDNSVTIMCNFAELVTREIEKDIVLARQNLQLEAGVNTLAAAADAAAASAAAAQDKVQLRSMDCLTSAVLLVDTAKPGWPVLHANSSWHKLLQARQQARMTSQWVDAGSSSSSSAGSSSSRSGGHSQDSIVGQPLWPLLAEQLRGRGSSPFGAEMQQQQQQQQQQQPPQQQKQQQLSRAPGQQQGRQQAEQSCKEQVQQLVADRQSFSLHGLQLPCFVGQPVSLSFRSAEHAELDGAISICLPSFIPAAAELPAAALALAASSSDHAPVTAEPAAPSLYFATVTVAPHNSSSRAAPCSSISASSSEVARMPAGDSCVSLVPCAFPQFATANNSSWESSVPGSALLARVAHGSTTSSSYAHGHEPATASIASSSVASAVCSQVEGLKIKNQIAAGSMGRVFKGRYFGTRVAVKVLDGDAVLRRDASTGLCLEAVLGQQLQHPNVVRTIAWAVITGEDRLPHAERLWGETLEPSKPSIALNRMRSGQLLADAALGPAATAAAGAGAGAALHAQQQGVAGVGAEGAGLQQAVLEEQTWMVLEYCDKGCLQDAVDRGWLREGPAGPVSSLKLLATASEIAAGMLHLHSQGIIHGDLSAFNVLLSSAGAAAAVAQRGFVAKIGDFGLARTLTNGSRVVTNTYGTITHMPPEMLEHGICSKAADVYSFGVLLFQMAASSRAWAGLSHQAVVHAVCVERLQLSFPADTPEAVVMLGEACMAFEPRDRPSFQDIADILRPLSEVLQVAN